jgi:energy-coupling factor transporter transmembrane protein EcfT
MFVLVFAILEKINIFGKEGEKKQVHAILALVIALIFVGAVFPKIVVANLIQFMTVGLVIIFVGLIMWGFASGEGKFPDGMVKPLGVIIGLAVVFAVLWATGAGGPLVEGIKTFFNFLFNSSWSGAFWGNALLIGIIGIVVAVVLIGGKDKK